MFTAEQYRARAVEYSQLVKIANSPAEMREFKRLEHTFTELADNAQWTVDNYDKTLHATSRSTGACKSGSEARQHRRKQQLVASVLGACRLQAAPR
jgi:hypothetical protein